jgi:hypothetical protein
MASMALGGDDLLGAADERVWDTTGATGARGPQAYETLTIGVRVQRSFAHKGLVAVQFNENVRVGARTPATSEPWHDQKGQARTTQTFTHRKLRV